jgi:hypothetical protein
MDGQIRAGSEPPRASISKPFAYTARHTVGQGPPAPAGPATRRQAGADRRSAARSPHPTELDQTPPRGDGREQPVPPPGTRKARARTPPPPAEMDPGTTDTPRDEGPPAGQRLDLKIRVLTAVYFKLRTGTFCELPNPTSKVKYAGYEGKIHPPHHERKPRRVELPILLRNCESSTPSGRKGEHSPPALIPATNSKSHFGSASKASSTRGSEDSKSEVRTTSRYVQRC